LESVRDDAVTYEVGARSRAASAIGRLGDPRPGVGLVKETKLPDIVFGGLISAGKFKLGETGAEMVIEQNYRLARYPVTVAQYQAFVEGGGYEDDGSPEAAARLGRWWTPEGLAWKRENEISGPENYAPVFQTPNHPRVGVSWFEAVAFCRWLSEKTGQFIRLPREVEWERAARGPEGREYPWGGEKDLLPRCNMDETGIESTSAVGLFPLGDTPAEGGGELGLADMAGNVWEWCQTKYRSFGDHVEPAEDEKLEGDEGRALRGGSWGDSAGSCRSAVRGWDWVRPGVLHRCLGFRVCLVPGPKEQTASKAEPKPGDGGRGTRT
jgi:formylglycine-generating enzyme required for sulfatase activity